MPPVINDEKCIACGTCVNVCPMDVFWGSEEREIPIINYPDECWHCNSCILECPAEGAIKLRIPLTAMLLYKNK